MVDPFGIIGLTGTAEQIVVLVKDLIERHDAYKENKPLAEKLLSVYTSLSEDTASLRDDPHLNNIQEPHRKILKSKVDQVSEFVDTTLSELKKDLQNPRGKLHAFSRAISDRQVLIERKQGAEKQREKIESASGVLLLVGEVRSGANARDTFHAASIAPQNPKSVYINLCLQGDVEQPQDTCERRLKATVLKRDGKDQVGAFARGQGGVGKTCTLRAIANDKEVIDRFPGGIYFMQLGENASVAELMKELHLTAEVTGGRSIAQEMRGKTTLREAVALMRSWFAEHICLFIFDDVWARNGIDANVLNQLSVLVGNSEDKNGRKSRILYSTRDEDLTIVGQEIIFEPRERYGIDAQKMFLRASDTEKEHAEDDESKMAIRQVLGICAGLPVALSAAGKNIRIRKGRNGGDFSGACNAYLESVRDRGGMFIESPGDGYLSIERTLQSSLKLLDSDSEARSRTNKMSFEEMHSALCVMKKQDWLPITILCDLWDTGNMRDAEKIANEMGRAGLVDLEDRNCAGVRVHDLTHDFAVRAAEEWGGCKAWYKKVLAKYSKDEEGDLVEVACRVGGTAKNEARAAYMFNNLYRLLIETERLEELRDLLLSARWAKRVLEGKAVLQFADAVASLQQRRSESTNGERTVKDVVDEDSMCGMELVMKGLLLCFPYCNERLQNKRSKSTSGERTVRDVVDEDSERGMELVMKALRLCLAYCDESDEATWFQLYARMMHRRRSLKSVEKFLSEIMGLAPRPWLCPVNECLHGAGEQLLETVMFPEDLQDGIVEIRQSLETQTMGEAGVVGCIWFEGRSEVAVFKYSEGKSIEILGSCGGSEQEVGVERDWHSNETPSSSEPNQGTDTSLRSMGGQSSSEVGPIGGGPNRSANSTGYSNERTSAAHVCGRGQRVAVGYFGGTVKVWSVKDRNVVRTFQIKGSYGTSMFLTSDGKLLACGCADGSVLVWSVESETERCVTMKGHTEEVWCVSISVDGNFVVSGSYNNIRVWDAKSGSPVGQPITGHTNWVVSVALSRDGRRLLSGSVDRTVRLWDARTGSQIGPTMRGHASHLKSVTMTEDGRRAISASYSEIIFWDLQTQTQLGDRIPYSSLSNPKVAMSADGNRALSWINGALKLWNLEAVAQAEEGKKARHNSRITSLALSKNGQRVIS